MITAASINQYCRLLPVPCGEADCRWLIVVLFSPAECNHRFVDISTMTIHLFVDISTNTNGIIVWLIYFNHDNDALMNQYCRLSPVPCGEVCRCRWLIVVLFSALIVVGLLTETQRGYLKNNTRVLLCSL